VVAGQVFAANLAIIDSGVDYKHKDLAAKMWTNPSNQTVADGTTYADDTHGWNFADNNNQIIDYKYLGTFPDDCYKIFDVQGKILRGTATQNDIDYYNKMKADQDFMKKLEVFGNFVHGTHVSGISSKDADAAKIIALKIIPTEPPQVPGGGKALPARRIGRDADNPIAMMYLNFVAQQQAQLLTTAGKYAAAVKADVANGSFGTSVAEVSPVLQGALKQFLGHDPTPQETHDYSVYLIQQIIADSKDFVGASPNTLFVFAAGNDGTDNDSTPTSPANVKADNTIAVAATMDVVKLASFSNYGATMVEVAAPGVTINSTVPGDKYMELSGTSMAAPYVTNAAGMVKDANPSFTPAQIKQVLVGTVDIKSFLQGKVSSSGIVNRDRAVHAATLAKTMSLDAAIAQARKDIPDMPQTIVSRAALDDSNLLVIPLPSTL
jgi:subtilisin family serine protease